MPLFGKRRPAFQLTGLVASPDGLYDGSFVAACARWWNYEVERRSEMRAAGYQPFMRDDVVALCEVIQPENRVAFEAIASNVSLPGRLSAAVLSLAYAFALMIDAGAAQLRGEYEQLLTRTQPPPFTGEDLVELGRHYSDEGAAREYQIWMPFWMAAPSVFDDRVSAKLFRSLRASFDDQVDRWGAAEGQDLRRSIGPVDYSLVAFNEDEHAGFANFVELLFEWGGRLRVGERFLAAGDGLAGERFGQIDETGFIDHLYDEAFARYYERASEDNPVDAVISDAVAGCVAWLGNDKSEAERSAITTVAFRAYLWRQAHERVAYDFMEPGLSEAIEESRGVGDDRGPDEPLWLTLYYAASQCIADGVHTRLGSIGGLIHGAKVYEKAVYDTTDDLDDLGLTLDDQTKRTAFQFGVCLADVEHMLARPAAAEA